jgi:hypothetical protein
MNVNVIKNNPLIADCERPTLNWCFSVELGELQGFPTNIALSMDNRNAILFKNTTGPKYVEDRSIRVQDAIAQGIRHYQTQLLIPPP